MKIHKIRLLFKFLKWSSVLHVDQPIPSDYAIPNVEETLVKSGLIIISPNRPHNLKWISYKLFLILLLWSLVIKHLCLINVDVKLEENRKLISILGDISFFISSGGREFFLTAGCMIAITSSNVIYNFSFEKNLHWMKLFHFLEGKRNKITPRDMGITDVEYVKEMIARYKFSTHFFFYFIPSVTFIVWLSL